MVSDTAILACPPASHLDAEGTFYGHLDDILKDMAKWQYLTPWEWDKTFYIRAIVEHDAVVALETTVCILC